MSWALPFHSSATRRRRAWHARAAALLALCLACLCCTAVAQTCEVPQTLRSKPVQFADTCSGDTSISSICDGEVVLNGPVGIWRFRVGAGANAVLELWDTGAGFSPVGFLVAANGACGGGDCHGYVDATTPLDLATVQPGDYHLIVTASEWDAAGSCGAYGLSLSGGLGGADQVFADGFD